jgi:hypothetical protein
MKTFFKAVAGLALILCLSAGSARATTFDFSYLFGDDSVVTGSFTGDLNGNVVDNVANVLVLFNGGASLGSFTGFGSDFVSPPVVSFDATANDFYFVSDDPDNFAVFSMVGALGTADAFFPTGAAGDNPLAPARWTLTAVATPDTGGTVLLLGLSLAGLAWLHGRARPPLTPR